MGDPLDDLGLGGLPASLPPVNVPQVPDVNTLLPQKGIADKLAPLAVLLASALGGPKMRGAVPAFVQGQRAIDQQHLQEAQMKQSDVLRQQQIALQAQAQQQRIEQQRQQALGSAMQSIKTRVGAIKDKGQYDQEIDAYAAMLQQAGFRMNPNQLRVVAPFVAPTAKQIAGDAVSAWLKNPANTELLKKDPTIVGKVMLRIDTNGDGIPENVPLLRAGELGGIQFAEDEAGQAIALPVKADEPKIGDKFKELYGTKLQRFIAENKRQPEPKEKEQLIKDAISEGAEEQRKPESSEDAAIMGLTPAGLDAAALAYAKTGQLPPMGMGKAGAAVRTRIINRAAEKYGGTDPLDVAANKATYAANQGSLTQLTKIANATDAFAKTASDNLDLAVQQSGNVPRTGSRLVNRYLQWAQGELTPAEGLSQFETYIYTAAREYAKVTSGGAMSAQGLTDSAAREATKLLNAAMSPKAFSAAVKAMKDDMANVQSNYKKQIGQLQGQMRGVNGQAAPAPTAPPDDTGWTDVGGGILIRPKKP